MKRPFGRGPTTRSLGGLSFYPWKFDHKNESWDDPPSREQYELAVLFSAAAALSEYYIQAMK